MEITNWQTETAKPPKSQSEQVSQITERFLEFIQQLHQPMACPGKDQTAFPITSITKIDRYDNLSDRRVEACSSFASQSGVEGLPSELRLDLNC